LQTNLAQTALSWGGLRGSNNPSTGDMYREPHVMLEL
jgi:hypothetical protein